MKILNLQPAVDNTTNLSASYKDFSVKLDEHIKLWGLFGGTVFVIYILPTLVDYLFFFFVFILFANSKKDYLWLAYFVLLTYAPFGFFQEGARDAVYRLPIFSAGVGFSFTTLHIFLFIGLGKALLKKNKIFSYFRKHYKVLLIYLVLLAVIAIVIHGTNMGKFIDRVQKVINFAFIFIIYKLITKREEKYKFIFLLLPFVFLILMDVFYFFISGGEYIYEYFNPYFERKETFQAIEGAMEVKRWRITGFELSYVVFIFSLSFSFIKEHRNYFILVALSAFIAIFAASLRSWFVIYSISLLFFILYSTGKLKRALIGGVLFLFLLVPILQVSTGKEVLSGAWERISTVFTITEESSASTKSIQNRIQNDLPRHFSLIKKSPLTGWAFTEKQGNGDVGNFALLVDVGFLGFFIFLWFWISYVRILRNQITRLKTKEAKKALKMLIVLFLTMFLGHFSTVMIFGIYNRIIFVGLLVFITEFIISETKTYDKQVLQQIQSKYLSGHRNK